MKSYLRGDVGKAWSAAQKLVESDDADIAADAKFLTEKTQALAAFRRTVCEDAIAARDIPIVDEDLGDLVKTFEGMPIAEWAEAKAKELNADPDIKNERAAWKALAKVQAAEKKAGTKDKKLRSVRKSYLKLAEKYAGTKAAEKATAAASALGRYAD